MKVPKHRQIFEQLADDILNGRYKPGQKFPSEAALVKRFGASRITIGRAVRDLQQSGFIERVAGSGTWVRSSGTSRRDSLLFGLMIPNLGDTEIFEPICQAIAQSPDAAGHALLWGHLSNNDEAQMMALCEQYIARSVSGVFFAPLEMSPVADAINRNVLNRLTEAGVPVVLLDRKPRLRTRVPRYDLVAIDNRWAGYLAAEHLINAGATRIGFVSVQHQASTVELRLAGFQEALAAHGLTSAESICLESQNSEDVTIDWRDQFDGIVCANDRIAGVFMHSLLGRGVRIPQDVRIVGIDDVRYASLLPVPLTTIHQPCRDIGEAALRVMLERIDRPHMAAREVLLDCSIVVRRSCGTREVLARLPLSR